MLAKIISFNSGIFQNKTTGVLEKPPAEAEGFLHLVRYQITFIFSFE